MSKISSRVNSLAVSATLAMSQKSGELKAQGVDVINLSVGEPDFNTPDHIKKAAQKAIDENYTRYTPVAGYQSLREAICGKLKKENNLEYTPNQIICSNGAKQAICNTILTLVDPGDEVVIPAPCWVSYIEMVKLAEGTPVIVETGLDSDFKVTPEQLEAAFTDKTKAVFLCTPSNPTGSIYSKAELEAIAKVIEKYPNVYVLSDEVYEHINYVGKHESIAQFDKIKEQVIVFNAVSKAYAMTGWRLGWMAAPEWLAKAVNKLQGQYSSNCSSIAQKAAEAAYLGPQDYVSTSREAFERRRDLIVKLAGEIKGFKINKPEGAFYLFPEVSYYFGKSYNGQTIETSSDLALYLLAEAHVSTVGGDAFGAPDYLRFSYATSEEQITEAFRRVKEALDKLQ